MKSICKSITLLSALAIAMIGTAAAELKIASVDMQKLFNDYHKTKEAQESLQVEQAAIQKKNNERLTEIKEIEAEIQKFRKMIEDPSLSDKKRLDIENDARRRISDGNALDRERREFLKRKNSALNEQMVARMRTILQEIQDVVSEVAAAKDIDFVFDSSGRSQSQVPLILHAKDKYDITGETLEVLKKLNEEGGEKATEE